LYHPGCLDAPLVHPDPSGAVTGAPGSAYVSRKPGIPLHLQETSPERLGGDLPFRLGSRAPTIPGSLKVLIRPGTVPFVALNPKLKRKNMLKTKGCQGAGAPKPDVQSPMSKEKTSDSCLAIRNMKSFISQARTWEVKKEKT